jgi:hypothetical protein
MGKLGFYYTPTKRFKDRVTCFCCKKVQSTWKNVKDPTQHHLKKNPSCRYSQIHGFIMEIASNPDFDWTQTEVFNDPLSEEATDLRRETFGTSWPYDRIQGANPTSDKMIAAGFTYYPQERDDDLAICIYCGTSLEGWELDDDPMTEHRKRAMDKGCYFISTMDDALVNTSKRKSDSHLELPVEKKPRSILDSSIVKDIGEEPEVAEEEDEEPQQLTSLSDDNMSIRARPRRLRKVLPKLNVDLSSSSFERQHDEDESFGITANDEQLNSEEEYFESSRKKSNKTKSDSTTLKNNSSKIFLSKGKSSSPLKKSRILDSSFDNDGLFGNSKALDLDLTSLPKAKVVHKGGKLSAESGILQDITNFEKSASPKKTQEVAVQDNRALPLAEKAIVSDYGEDEDEDEIILVSNSKESIASSRSKGASDDEVEKEEENEHIPGEREKKHEPKEQSIDTSETLRPKSHQNDILESHEQSHGEPSVCGVVPQSPLHQSPPQMIQQQCPPQHLQQNQKTPRSESVTQLPSVSYQKSASHHSPFYQDSSSISQLHPSPLAAKTQTASPTRSEHLESLSRPELNLSKSLSRFFESPKRSQSPFLDPCYKGDDQIEPIIGSDDIPIEESTDHNIQLLARANELDKTEERLMALSEADDSSKKSETSFHSAPNEASDMYWSPADANKLLETLDDLETAKKFLSELQDLPYELNDDIDGRVSYFINEMPDEELEMTISQWINHTAEQGRSHLEIVCSKMLTQFDDECTRALDRLRRLPTRS